MWRLTEVLAVYTQIDRVHDVDDGVWNAKEDRCSNYIRNLKILVQ